MVKWSAPLRHIKVGTAISDVSNNLTEKEGSLFHTIYSILSHPYSLLQIDEKLKRFDILVLFLCKQIMSI